MSEPRTLTWTALLTELSRTPAELRALLSEVPSALVYGRPAPDRWSVGEIVAHLCAVEPPYRARLARIALEENPRVAVIESTTGSYDPETPVSILLDTFARLRADTLALLRPLPPAARIRPAVHLALGPITLRSQVESLLAHDREHLAQIAVAVGREDVKT